jgi:hypothetical protein
MTAAQRALAVPLAGVRLNIGTDTADPGKLGWVARPSSRMGSFSSSNRNQLYRPRPLIWWRF